MDKALEAIEHEQKLYEPLIASSFEKQTYNEFMSAWSDYMMAHATALGLVDGRQGGRGPRGDGRRGADAVRRRRRRGSAR